MCAVYQIRVEGTYICNPRHENHDNKKIVVIKYAKNRQIYTYRGFGTTVDKAHVPSENRKIFHKEYTLNTEIRHQICNYNSVSQIPVDYIRCTILVNS